MIKCNFCQLEKDKLNNNQCLSCRKKVYYQHNKEKILERRRKHYQNHKEEKHNYNQIYYQNNKEELIKEASLYYLDNKEKIKESHNLYYQERRLQDINFKIRNSVSANINYHLKLQKSSKQGNSCLEYLPFTIDDLKNHLQSLFESWMAWSNYGKYKNTWKDEDLSTWTWQIDHIIPHSTFSYLTMEEQSFRDCWSLNNLRPYSAKDNFIDGITRIRHGKINS